MAFQRLYCVIKALVVYVLRIFFLARHIPFIFLHTVRQFKEVCHHWMSVECWMGSIQLVIGLFWDISWKTDTPLDVFHILCCIFSRVDDQTEGQITNHTLFDSVSIDEVHRNRPGEYQSRIVFCNCHGSGEWKSLLSDEWNVLAISLN